MLTTQQPAPAPSHAVRGLFARTPLSSKAPARMRTAVMSFDQEAFIAESKEMRLKHLEEQVSARVSWEWEQGRWL